MMSFAMYRKLKSAVDAWKHEERGKAKVAAGAAYALAAWLALSAAGVIFLPAYWIAILLAGFLLWTGFVTALMRKHLGAPRR